MTEPAARAIHVVARALGSGCFCASLAITPALFAADASPTSGSDPAASAAKPELLLTVAGSAPDRRQLGTVTAELLSRLGVTVTVEAAAQISLASLRKRDERDTPYLAHGFVDLTDTGHATLYLLDPERDRLLVRELTHADQDSELLREELGHILEASIEGLLSGARIGEERAQVVNSLAPPSTPTPTRNAQPRPAAPPRVVERPVRVAALYEAGLLGSAAITHGPEGALVLQIPGVARLGALLSAQYRFPVRVGGSPVSARLLGGALRLLGTWQAPLGADAHLILGVGAGVDLVRVETLASAADVTLAEPRWLSIAILRASLAFELRLSGSVSGFAALAADLDPQHTHYVLGRDSGESSIFEPWLVRPSLIAGILVP